MLGRVANGIFWMYRYLERAENTARLLAAGQRMALTRGAEAATAEWRSILTTLGLRQSYEGNHDDFTSAHVCDFVLRAKANPESVLAMVERARFNARTCRSAITLEVWEAINDGWMNLGEMLARPVRDAGLNQALAAIRRESTLVRGATHGSMMRNEIYSFARAGTFIERADNTARILDVKYYLLLPSLAHVGTALDTAQWDNVLRSLSGERAYRWLNAGRMDARSIAEFVILDVKYYLLLPSLAHVGTALDTAQWDNVLRSLSGERAYRWLNAGRMDARSIAEFVILDDRFPRSLAFCYATMRENLASLARLHGHEGPAHELMRLADQQLTGKSIEEVFDEGLHEFLLGFIVRNRAVASAIAEQYRFTA